MYLRRSTRHKNGKAHDYWRLVRSVRRGSKVVQETVAQLGELDAEGRARAKVLARQITGGYVQASLFDEPSSILESARIRVDRVRFGAWPRVRQRVACVDDLASATAR